MFLFKQFKKEIKTEIIQIDDLTLPVKIHYEKRRNSRASITPNSINIRIPYYLNALQREKEEIKFKTWAIKKLKENTNKFKPSPKHEYQNNDTLEIAGKRYTIKIDYKDKRGCSARLEDNTIYLRISANLTKDRQNKNISTLLSRLAGQERLPKLKEKINNLNTKFFNRKVRQIAFKHQKSRWGSCSSTGNINISTRLLFAPDDVLEYVCIHELAHLICLNHSPKFWDLVSKAMPDYKEKQEWLKKNGHKYIF